MSPCVVAHHFTRENTFSCGFFAVIPQGPILLFARCCLSYITFFFISAKYLGGLHSDVRSFDY